MNERIKQLSKQAVDYASACEAEAWDGAYERKFAELIVRECADYVQFYYKDHACEVIAHDMKTHFGVE